jgi:uracil-DNA glycosylase family 4
MKTAKHANCSNCPFGQDKFTQVPSVGPKDPKIIVVGEGPGQHEAAVKTPFTGQSGQILRGVLKAHGYHPRDDVYYTNATMCWPVTKANKEKRIETALAQCQGRLKYTLEQLPTVPVLVLGKWAQKALGIEVAERWEQERLTGKPALAGIHPAAALYNPTQMVYFEKLVEKFAHGFVGRPRYPGDKYYIENPPPPDVDQEYGRICLDIEANTTQWYAEDAHIFLLGIATQSGERWLFTDEYMQQAEFQAWLRAFVAQHDVRIGGHNYKFDALFLNRQFGTSCVVGWDTISMVNVLHEHWHKDLKSLATYFFEADDYAERLVHSWLKANIKKAKDRSFDKVPTGQIHEYLLCDIDYNLQLSFALEALLNKTGQFDMPYVQHEIPQINLLTKVEQTGFAVDLERVEAERRAMGKDVALLTTAIQEMSNGTIVKPGSNDQVAAYLYDRKKRPVAGYTKTGKRRADKQALTANEDLVAVQALQAFRRVRKLKTSYLDNLSKFIVYDKYGTPRVHPVMKHWNVVTHRLAVERPALQTIPHKDEKTDTVAPAVVHAVNRAHSDYTFDGDYGTRIKSCYVASPGHMLVGGDGKSWEVACATAQSGDEFLANLFRAGQDPHSGICDKLFGDGWTKADRVKEKNIFFGWIYGGTLGGLVHETGLPIEDVAAVIEFLEGNLVGLKQWRLDLQYAAAKLSKIVLPHYNYHYHFDLITERVLRDLPKHAVNYPNQGLGSMLISRAAILAQPCLRILSAEIVMLVHDSFFADVPEACTNEAAQIINNSIVQAGNEFSTFIPWRADLEVGYRWSEMEEYTL